MLPGEGELIDIGSGVERSVIDIARTCAELIGVEPTFERWPHRRGEGENYPVADTSAMVRYLDFEPPDVCVVSVGDGCIVSSLHKGFAQFRALGLVRREPRLLGVQAAGADALVRAFETGEAPQPVRARSYADSISVGKPRNGLKALEAVRASGGAFVRVEDAAIREAQLLLARRAGVFGEPAGVTGLAGLLQARAQGLVEPHERVVVLVTGSGLKDIDGARTAVGEPTRVGASLAELRPHLRRSP